MTTDDYLFWNNRFDTEAYVFGTAPAAFLARSRRLLPSSGRALAIADGEGRNGVFLAECGLEVLSVDFSPKAQEKVRALAEARGVNVATETADIVAWDWGKEDYDVIVGIFFQFCGPDDRAKIFAGIRRALKPGGLLLLEGYRPEQLAYGTGGPKQVENLYTRATLEAAFGDFRDLEIVEYDAELDEGAAHTGPSALIDLIGRKP